MLSRYFRFLFWRLEIQEQLLYSMVIGYHLQWIKSVENAILFYLKTCVKIQRERLFSAYKKEVWWTHVEMTKRPTVLKIYILPLFFRLWTYLKWIALNYAPSFISNQFLCFLSLFIHGRWTLKKQRNTYISHSKDLLF